MIAPRVVTREEWGATWGRGSEDPGAEELVVIHHASSPHLDAGVGLEVEAAAVRSIERFHKMTRGWAGIGYNWLVTQSGNVFEGRGWQYQGAHTAGKNRRAIGVCLLIDGERHDPSRAALESIEWLIAEGIVRGELADPPEVSGHRDHGETTCPGDRVYAQLGGLGGS